LLLLLLVSGCASAKDLFALVVPEQTHLDIREPTQIADTPLPALPPPVTVSNPAPAVVPKLLSLDEAIHIALANTRVVRVLAQTTALSTPQTIYDPAISNTSIDVARAVFDPTLTIKQTFDHTETPVPFLDPSNPIGTTIAGTTTTDSNLDVNLSKRNVTGGTLSLDFQDIHSRFQPGVFPLNPQDRSALTLSYTQPLLKGAGVAANVAPIVIARLDTERSYYQFNDSMQELVRGVIEAYWNVVFARTDVWAKQQQVEQADGTLKRAEALLSVGKGTAGDVAQQRVSLYNFKANLIGAEANQLQREDALRNLLGLPPNEPLRIVPITPAVGVRVEPRWDETLKLAESQRPDLIELQLAIEEDQQTLIIARNQAQPQVDATLFYRWNDLEGRTPTGASAAADFADWSLGINLSVPLGLRQSRAALRRAELNLLRDRANLEQGVHNAVHELSGTFRSLAQNYEEYLAFKVMREAARENLNQQLALYEIQKKTIYLNVLQAITDWGNAVSSEAQALTQYNVQLATLERQTGTILETHGVSFFEDRYRSLGPLGRLGRGRLYPLAVPPGPNAPRYPVAAEPADQQLERDRPGGLKSEEPTTRPRLLGPQMP
jgi:outer membrane protein TolC